MIKANNYPGIARFSVSHCLVALIVTYVSIPFLQHIRHGIFLEALAISMVMIFSLLAIGHSKKVLIVALVLMMPAFAAKWVHCMYPSSMARPFYLASCAVFCMFIVIQLLRFVFNARRIDSEVLSASVASYLIIALIWGFLYQFIDFVIPGAFAYTLHGVHAVSLEGFTGLYFSFSVLATVGFGDIVPVSSIARMVAVCESTIGVLYITMIISRLVSLYGKETKTKNVMIEDA